MEIYPNLSAPAVNYQGQGYVTFHQTITAEKAIAYWRDERFIIATRPKSGWTHDIRLDLDQGGRCWDAKVIRKIQGLFEEHGLAGSVVCRSSESDGRWLVIPLPEPMPSWQAALTADSILRVGGYDIEAGHLEICPNVKRWVDRGREAPFLIKSDWIIDHHAFRLPGQNGFEILDNYGETIGLTLEDYLYHWDWAQSQQCVEEWEAAIAHYSKKENRPKPKYAKRGRGIEAIAQEHLELLAQGFTDAAQTNDIGLNLARRNRILYAGDVEEQTERIKADFIAMPGYREHCHHHHEIGRRCGDLARWAAKNWTYYGDRQLEKVDKEPHPNRNEVRHNKALNKGLRTLKGFLANGFGFTSKNKIFAALKKNCGFGKKTFFKYLKEVPKFTLLVSRLLIAGKQVEQGFETSETNQFTPLTTKRRNCADFSLNKFSSAGKERKNLPLEVSSTSGSADKDLSVKQIAPPPKFCNQHSKNTQKKASDIEHIRCFVRVCCAVQRSPHPFLFVELDDLSRQFGITQLQSWLKSLSDTNANAGFDIWFLNRRRNPDFDWLELGLAR